MTDALCRNCAHLRTGADQIDRCYSPQILTAQNGRGTRTIFERDGCEEGRGDGDRRKCGKSGTNFVRRTA